MRDQHPPRSGEYQAWNLSIASARTPAPPPPPPHMALSEAHRRLVADLVLDTTTQGVWLIDGNSRTTFVNEHMAQMLGVQQGDMFGRHLFDFMDDEGRRLCHANLQRRNEGCSDLQVFKFLRSDGQILWVQMDTNPVAEGEGRFAGALAMVTDITARRAAEEALSAERENLERNVAVRTQELQEANRRLAELATRDGLTGLYNHRHFQERLEQELQRAQRYGSTLSLLFMDVDHFKTYNDTFGHPAGDELLRILSRLLQNSGTYLLRQTDVAARYGGEEFVVIVPETTLCGAVIVAERIRRAVESFPFPHPHPITGGPVTVSIGASELQHGEDTKGSLLARADAALYAAKAAGRNRVHASAPSDPLTTLQ